MEKRNFSKHHQLKKQMSNATKTTIDANLGEVIFDNRIVEKTAYGDIKWLANLTGYTPNYIRILCRLGKIPHLPKKGRQQYRFKKSDVVMWLERRNA